MTKKQALALKPGNIINHTEYGAVRVQEVMISRSGNFLGVLIIPEAEEHKIRLTHKGKTVDLPLLETSTERVSMEQNLGGGCG